MKIYKHENIIKNYHMKLNCVDYKFAFYKFKIEFRIKSQLSDKKNIYHFFMFCWKIKF